LSFTALIDHKIAMVNRPHMGQHASRFVIAAGGSLFRPRITGIGAEPRHHEQRKPSTRLPIDASG